MPTGNRRSTTVSLALLAGILLMSTLAGDAQEKKQSAASKYPKISLATWYEVDAHWPQKPDEFKWGDMPGVAVDKDDHVWIFTRSTPPVQVYDADGRFIRGWGDDTVKRAHHIKFDR